MNYLNTHPEHMYLIGITYLLAYLILFVTKLVRKTLLIFWAVNSRFKKDLNLQVHLHKALFSDDRFLDSLHKFFLNQTTLNLRVEKWTFLNKEFTVEVVRVHFLLHIWFCSI